MKMPDKPDTWAAVLAWLSQHAPIIYASLLSWAMAMARIIYGGGTRRQALLEGALCGGAGADDHQRLRVLWRAAEHGHLHWWLDRLLGRREDP